MNILFHYRIHACTLLGVGGGGKAGRVRQDWCSGTLKNGWIVKRMRTIVSGGQGFVSILFITVSPPLEGAQ